MNSFDWKKHSVPMTACHAVVLILMLCPPGLAQSGGSAIAKAAWQLPGLSKSLKNTQNPEFKAEHLKKPVDLVDMQPYAGKKAQFITGTIFPNAKGGPSVTMQFSVNESPKDVLNWYRNNFSQNNWQELSDMTGANGLAYIRSHNICQIMTLSPSTHGSKCDLLVRYKFYKPTSFATN